MTADGYGSGATALPSWYNCYTNVAVRCKFDKAKSRRLRAKRGVGFEEAQELFYLPYYLDQLAGPTGQWIAIGWVQARLYSVVFEERADEEGDYYHLVTLWRSTATERNLYEENQ